METSSPQKTITLLGATGSIGDSTLALVRANPDRYGVHALSAHQNVQKLAALVLEFQPKYAIIVDETQFPALKDQLSGTPTKLLAGRNALAEVAADHVDIVVAAITGTAGLPSVHAALKAGNTVALANKESLVCAGDYLMPLAARAKAHILPIDSEHNAIYQVFDFDRADRVRRIILTASGGPFRETPLNEFNAITPAQAVAHPNWDMGAKISVDSATMMNKGLEMIEAYHLFPVSTEQIDVVIHPQSVIHSMVDYVDGSVLAQMGHPDMRTPISYCLAWPDRQPVDLPPLNLAELARLDFWEPDFVRYPCLKLAIEAMRAGGSAPLVLNAANEIAVSAFLNGQIGFGQIAHLVAKCLEKAAPVELQSLETIYELDAETRRIATEIVTQ